MDNIREIVFENLRNATENGYYCDLNTLSTLEIVGELLAFAYGCECYEEQDLLPHVVAWIESRRQTADALIELAKLDAKLI